MEEQNGIATPFCGFKNAAELVISSKEKEYKEYEQ